MSNHSRAESPAGKHSLVPVLVMHAILTVLLFVALIWLVPRFLLQFEDLLGVSPTPVEQLVTGVSDFFVRFHLFLLPVAAILLWLDARLCRMLQVRFGQCVVGVWSAGVVIVLTAAIFFIAYTFTVPSVIMHQFQQQQVQESEE